MEFSKRRGNLKAKNTLRMFLIVELTKIKNLALLATKATQKFFKINRAREPTAVCIILQIILLESVDYQHGTLGEYSLDRLVI